VCGCAAVKVNHSPSFTTDSMLDREIKDVLLFDTLNLINFGAVDRKRCIEEDRRRVKERLFAKQQDKKELKSESFSHYRALTERKHPPRPTCISQGIVCHGEEIWDTVAATAAVNKFQRRIVFSARCYASAAYASMRCLSVCLSVCVCL